MVEVSCQLVPSAEVTVTASPSATPDEPINTASPALLSHVAGLNKTISENIVKYREEEGKITSRAQIKKVPRLGAKAFEQAAGFLRIPESSNILDNTGKASTK